MVANSNLNHGLQRELLTTGNTRKSRAVEADSRLIKCDRFSYQQVIRNLHHCEHSKEYPTFVRLTSSIAIRCKSPARSIPSEYTPSDGSINHSVQDQPAYPASRRTQPMRKSTRLSTSGFVFQYSPYFERPISVWLLRTFPSCSRKTRLFVRV